MRITAILTIGILLGLSATPTLANSEFDIFGQIYKRPINGIVNVRKWASPNSLIVGQVTNGERVQITGGTCTNAKTGNEVDITIYKSKLSLYRKLKSPNIFCSVITDEFSGWVRGTHLMPDSGF